MLRNWMDCPPTLTQAERAASIKLPYLMLAGTLFLLAVAMALFRFPRLELTQDFRPGHLSDKEDSLWNYSRLYRGPLTIFIYAGLLVQGIVGGAVISVLMVFCADHYGIDKSLGLPLVCYPFIIFSGLRGYRIKPGEAQSHLEPAHEQ